jgi:hypothetical protein
MPQSKAKYNIPRRVMPGQPLSTPTQRAVDERNATHDREREFTSHGQFTMSSEPNPKSGARGFHLNKLDAEDVRPHVISFDVEGTPVWELGMDFDTAENERSDFVLAFDHSANNDVGADVFRISAEADSNSSATCKMVMGRAVGTPRNQGSFLLIDGGDDATALGGVMIRHFGSASTEGLQVLTRATANNRSTLTFGDAAEPMWSFGTDAAAVDDKNLYYYDQVNDKTRMFLKNTSGLMSLVGFGSTNPQAAVSIATSQDASLYDTVQRGLIVSYADGPSNRSINLEQILDASGVWNYVWLNGGLGAGSTRATRVTTSSFARAWGWESGDNQMAMVSAPSGTNQTIVRPLNVDVSGGNYRIGVFNVTPQARTAAYTQTYATTSRTVNAYTSDAESVAYTGIDNAQAGTVYATVADLNTLRTAYETLRASHDNLIDVVTQVIDDLQGYGWLQ